MDITVLDTTVPVTLQSHTFQSRWRYSPGYYSPSDVAVRSRWRYSPGHYSPNEVTVPDITVPVMLQSPTLLPQCPTVLDDYLLKHVFKTTIALSLTLYLQLVVSKVLVFFSILSVGRDRVRHATLLGCDLLDNHIGRVHTNFQVSDTLSKKVLISIKKIWLSSHANS